MNLANYEDITSLFQQVSKDLKSGQMIHTDTFSLHDSMSAIEIYDAKMDLKSNLKDCMSLDQALKTNLVKKPEDLTIREVVGILDDLLGKEMLWLSGQSLPHTIYTLAYLYDPSIYENHPFLKPYIDALYAGGAICQEVIRYSPYLREEDYIPSTIGFIQGKSVEEISKALVAAEDELGGSKKKKKKKQNDQEENKDNLTENDALYARLKLRRSLLSLYSNIKVGKFTTKLRDQTLMTITSCLNNLENVKNTLAHSENCEKYFIDSINKTLLCHIPPRQIKTISKQEAFTQLENMLNNLQTALQLSNIRDFYDIQKALQSFSLVPRNILVRAYVDVNAFRDGTYFGLISIKEIAMAALEEFQLNKGKDIISNDKVVKFVENSAAILEEILSLNLRNRSKQRREVCKIYHSLNIFAHDAYTLDDMLYSKGDEKVHVLFLWVLDIALKLMVKQLFQGFELGLYAEEDYCPVFFLLDHVFSFLDRNFNSVVRRLDKDFLMAWQQKQSIDKKKKKLTDFQKKFFYESMYYKAVENYVKVMLRLNAIVVKKGMLPVPDDAAMRFRYYQRLRVFDNVYFLKKNEYEDYANYIKQVEQVDVESLLKDMKGVLDQNVKLLKEIDGDETYDAHIKVELKQLQRICVMNSMAMMMLEKNKDKLGDFKATFSNKEHILYPVLSITKK